MEEILVGSTSVQEQWETLRIRLFEATDKVSDWTESN